MAPTAKGDHWDRRRRLRAVQAELDHLVSIRATHGFTDAERVRYEVLLAVEVELLDEPSPKAAATSS